MFEVANTVVARALSKGLRVERVIPSDQIDWDGRSLLVEDKPCQIIKTRYRVTNSPSKALSMPLYLPRTDWPDFLIYVIQTEPNELYILPRGFLSKSTEFSPDSLKSYRDAWNLFKEKQSPDQLVRRFAILNWQLQQLLIAAKKAGLEIALIRPRRHRRWPLFIQTRAIVGGRKCMVYSLSRMSPDPNHYQHNYVGLRELKNNWAEFQLCVLRETAGTPDIYVFPRGSITASSTVSLNNQSLLPYKNNWKLLSQPNESAAIEWKPLTLHSPKETPTARTTVSRPPKETPIAIREVQNAAEKHGLIVERPHLEHEYQLFISGKRCQIMQAKPVTISGYGPFVPLNLPRSDWAEFLIVFLRSDATATTGTFYVIPREKVPKRTAVSPTSSWIREYADAWHLLS